MTHIPTDLVGYILSWLPHERYVQHLLNRFNRTHYTHIYTVLQRRLHYLVYVLHPLVRIEAGAIRLSPTGPSDDHIRQYEYNNVLSLYLFVLGTLGIPIQIEPCSGSELTRHRATMSALHASGAIMIRGPGELPIADQRSYMYSYLTRALRRCRMPMHEWTHRAGIPLSFSLDDAHRLQQVEITAEEAMYLAVRHEYICTPMLPHTSAVEYVLRRRSDHYSARGGVRRGSGVTHWPCERLYPTILAILRLARQPAHILYDDLFTGCWEYIAHNSHLHVSDRPFSRQIGYLLYQHGPVGGMAEILRHMHAENWSDHWWGQFTGFQSHSYTERENDLFDFPIPAHIAWRWIRYYGTDEHSSKFIMRWAEAAGVRYYPEGEVLPKSGDHRILWR
jgi:hypothetical protein